MAAITFEELVQKGGGNIRYIYGVAGYPWVVTDDPDVVTALNAGDTAGKNARKKIFGSTLLNSPELLVDGDMEASGTSDWSIQNGATLSKETLNQKQGSQYLRITRAASWGAANNSASLTIGDTCRIQGWARGDGKSYPRVYNGSYIWTGTVSKAWQYFDLEFVVANATMVFIKEGSSGTYVDVDGVSVKRVTTYLAEDTDKFPIFATLQNFSKQSWRLDETRGSISGGDFSVEISDEDLPTKWSTTANIGNTDSLGLPGVHSMAQPRSDSAVGWGTLLNKNDRASTSLVVSEQDGGTLDTGIPDGELPDSEYRLLWVGQECVAASSVMPNSDELVVDGDMEAVGTAAWSPVQSATLTKETTDPKEGLQCLRVAYNGAANASTEQNILTVGSTYRVRGWARGDGVSSLPRIGDRNSVNYFVGTTSNTWQYVNFEFTPTSTYFKMNTTSTGYTEYDDISIKEVTTSNDITLTARGVARSRDADHWTSFFDNITSPLVIDTPPSIIDKPCTLWAIGMTDDGSSILTQPVIIREGVVGTDVMTNNGITRISCLSVLNRLDNDFQLPKYDGKLSKYVLYRGNVGVDDSTTSYGVYRRFEMPHLVIKEFTAAKPGESNSGTNKYIWLCARNSSVEFDSPEEVLQALVEELGRCEATDATANQSQLSGDATVGGYTQLSYHYEIRDGKLVQMDKDGTWSVTLSMITGPLAWCFNLGAVGAVNQVLPNGWGNSDMAGLIGNKRPWFVYPTPSNMELNVGVGNSTKDPWMVALSGVETSSTQYNRSSRYLEPYENWVADYYYSYQWSESYKNSLAIGQQVPLTNTFNVPEEAGGSTSYLYLRGEGAATQFSAGDEISIGSPTDAFEPGRPNYASFTISTIAVDDGDTKIAPTNEVISKVDTQTPFAHGRPLFSMRALDLASQDSNTDDPDENYDMWATGQRTSTVATTLGQLFRGILDDPNHGLDIPSIIQLTHIVGFTTEADFVSIIDWDDLDEKAKHAQQALGLGDYKFLLGDEVNLYDLLKSELLLHGLSPTYEWDAENDQFRIRFRYLAPLNETQAAFGGRIIDNSNLVHGQTTGTKHNDEWIANTAKIRANHDRGRFYRTYNLNYDSGFAMNRKASRNVSASSVISHISATEYDATNFFAQLLYQFATPDPTLRAQLGYNAFLDIALGRECAVTDETARNPYDHTLGLTDKPALITSISFGAMGAPGQDVSYRIGDKTTTGYAPACYVQANNSEKIASSRITCASDLHEFSNITDRVDCMWFGCYTWNPSTNTYTAKTDCGCGEYKILAFERYKKSISVLEFNVFSISSDGTIVIEDQDGGAANYTAWSETANYVLVFADWDDVETCQQKFLYYADDNNSLGSGSDRGFRWG
jgi:hypothetical protein